MISRYPIICPGCEEPFLVRLGVAPTKMTRFYVPCPSCKLPIRGRSYGEDLLSHKVEFNAELYKNKKDPDLIVTIDPNVPSRYEATQMGGLGTAPNMTLMQLGGDRTLDLMTYLGRGQQAVKEWWPQVHRIYEYYLEGDWARFEKSGKAAFGDKWPSGETTHERATAAHQAVGVVLAAVVDDDNASSATFLRRYLRKHTAALKSSGSYIAFARQDAESGLVATLQRRLFDVLDLFIQRYESWEMGVLRRVIPDDSKLALNELRLFRDEFDILRDLYQQGFETICKALRYPVAAQNTVKRGEPNSFGSDVPAALNRRSNPATIAAFERLSNFDRLQYVAQVPGWEDFVGLLDNRTRNAIGHATARHDLRTGLILSDTTPNGVPYLDVVTDVYGIFDALCVCLQVVRSIRVMSSSDFKDGPA